MICRHCAYKTLTRLMSGDEFMFCPRCGCPSRPPLNPGLRKPASHQTFREVRVFVNGVELEGPIEVKWESSK